MNEDLHVPFEFEGPLESSRSIGGELSKGEGQGWSAELVGALTVSLCVKRLSQYCLKVICISYGDCAIL